MKIWKEDFLIFFEKNSHFKIINSKVCAELNVLYRRKYLYPSKNMFGWSSGQRPYWPKTLFYHLCLMGFPPPPLVSWKIKIIWLKKVIFNLRWRPVAAKARVLRQGSATKRKKRDKPASLKEKNIRNVRRHRFRHLSHTYSKALWIHTVNIFRRTLKDKKNVAKNKWKKIKKWKNEIRSPICFAVESNTTAKKHTINLLFFGGGVQRRYDRFFFIALYRLYFTQLLITLLLTKLE